MINEGCRCIQLFDVLHRNNGWSGQMRAVFNELFEINSLYGTQHFIATKTRNNLLTSAEVAERGVGLTMVKIMFW